MRSLYIHSFGTEMQLQYRQYTQRREIFCLSRDLATSSRSTQSVYNVVDSQISVSTINLETKKKHPTRLLDKQFSRYSLNSCALQLGNLEIQFFFFIYITNCVILTFLYNPIPLYVFLQLEHVIQVLRYFKKPSR